MWGHLEKCSCPVCLSLARVGTLIQEGTKYPGFVARASLLFRDLEGKLRDDLEVCRRSLIPGLPPLPPPPVGESNPPNSPQRSDPQLVGSTPKGVPARPPKGLSQVKEEPAEEGKGPVEDVIKKKENEEIEAEENKERARRSRSRVGEDKRRKEKKNKEKRRSKSRSRKRRRREEEEETGVERTPKKETARGSREAEETEEIRRDEGRGKAKSPAPNEERGKERKYRPRELDTEIERRPRETGHQDRRKGGERGPSGKGKGKGWYGTVPYSQHPRWHGKNKGVVKRAKQERFNRERR